MKRRFCLYLSALCLAAVCGVTPRATANPPVYTITDLGTLGGYSSQAFSLNATGEVAGSSSTVDGFTHAFLFSGGAPLDLGTLPGGSNSYALGINSTNQVAGYADTSDGFQHAFLYSNGQIQDLGTLPGGLFSFAQAINTAGQVVGDSATANGSYHAFLYTGGAMTDLGLLTGGSYSNAYALNDQGQVVGQAATATGVNHAFLYSGGKMQDIDAASSPYSIAYAINNAGQVAGGIESSSDRLLYAFVYAGSMMSIIGGSDTVAYGINDLGQVVGSFGVSNGGTGAFLYSGSTLIDLSTTLPANSGWMLQAAVAINDNGQIAGYGFNSDFEQHAFLLTPVPQDTSPPTTTAALAGTQAGANVYVGSVQVTLSATDPDGASDVAATHYQVDGGTVLSYGGPFTISSTSSHTVSFYSVDKTGNTETTKSVTFSIIPPDTSPPTTAASLSGSLISTNLYYGSVQVALSATDPDGASDVAATYYQVDGGASQTYSSPISVSGLGSHTVSFYSVDKIGNKETAHSVAFTIRPRYNIVALYDQTKAVKSGATVPIKIEVCDASGNNISSSTLTVHATGVAQISASAPGSLEDSGSSNPDNDFRFDSTVGTSPGGYVFNLKTTGDSTGTYQLNFTVAGDPGVTYSVQFQVK